MACKNCKNMKNRYTIEELMKYLEQKKHYTPDMLKQLEVILKDTKTGIHAVINHIRDEVK